MGEMTASFKRAVVVAFVIAVMPGAASGQPGPPPTVPAVPAMPAAPAATAQPQTRTQFYGWQLFLADAMITSMALRSQRAEPVIAILLSGPLIHGLHGRGHAALSSLLLRATVPILGLMFGAETCVERPVDDDRGCLDDDLIGFGVGAAVVFGLDYFALARKTVKVGPARARPAVTMTATASSAAVRFDF
jgi:hypothetical protein